MNAAGARGSGRSRLQWLSLLPGRSGNDVPDALELEGPHERFDDAVLLGRMRQDELLAQPILASKISVELGGVDQRVVGAQDDVGVALWQRPESTQERVLQRPSGFLGIVAPADVATDAFVIGAVQHCVDVDQAVPLGPHVGRLGRPAPLEPPVTPRPSDTPGTARSRSAT